jgi:hypothetical protein
MDEWWVAAGTVLIVTILIYLETIFPKHWKDDER